MNTDILSSVQIKELTKVVADGRRNYLDIWQLKLLQNQKLCEFARDRGLAFWCSDNVTDKFWKLSLLNADRITSEKRIRMHGITSSRKVDWWGHVYQDRRKSMLLSEGMQGIFSDLEDVPAGLRLEYHPFRYYVLAKIDHQFKFSASPARFFYDPGEDYGGLEYFLNEKREHTASRTILDDFAFFNATALLAIACEPLSMNRVLGFYRWSGFNLDGTARSLEDYLAERRAYRDEFMKILENIGKDRIETIHRSICRDALDLDPNVEVHQLLRLSARDYRLDKVKGKLGGSLYLLAMAETIRRTAEEAFNIELPEEDESGYYFRDKSLKEYRFGSERLLDNKGSQRHFLRSLGLTREIRLRWYVEGDTEFEVLRYLVGEHGLIELVNLRGQVAAKGGKGLAFSDDLQNDIKANVFSWVSIDGDIDPYVRILRKAAKEEKMFGLFFISTPDFEINNFSTAELSDIVIAQVAKKTPVSDAERHVLHEQTSGCVSNTEFFTVVKRLFPNQPQVGKGGGWGQALGEFVLTNRVRTFPDGTKQERDVARAIREALVAVDSNYHTTRPTAA